MNLINKYRCKLCYGDNFKEIINLGQTPLANSYLNKKDYLSRLEEKTYPLNLKICSNCKLCQVVHKIKPSNFFVNYDYLSKISTTWIRHCKDYTNYIINKYKL